MKSNPLVSVIIGVYNTPKKYVEYALNSILNQTFQNFEIILCNDGCSDDTFKFIESKYGHNSKVRLIYNEYNKGLAFTLNHCLKESKGKYIARMDTDDFSHENRFEKQVDFLEKNPDVGLVNCNINVFDENGIYGERINNFIISKTDFLKNNPIIHPAVMFRKSDIEKVGGYRDVSMTLRNEDYDLFMRMFANGTKMCTIQEKLFDFREDKASYKRRKYKYRINEFRVRKYGFKILKQNPLNYIYVFKPLIVGLVPMFLLKKIRER